MDVLILSTLARKAMHGYEIKLELRYKHAHWWAKCEHGHLYLALQRLARAGHIAAEPDGAASRSRRTFRLTPQGRGHLEASLRALLAAADSTYFDVDLVLAGAFALRQEEALEGLRARRAAIVGQHLEARALSRTMKAHVPAVARLIMAHRVEHLAREAAFLAKAVEVLSREKHWGPFLASQSIVEFVQRTGVHLEGDEQGGRGRKPRRPAPFSPKAEPRRTRRSSRGARAERSA
jgi:DNA-binding PadR family transcriptional regulator